MNTNEISYHFVDFEKYCKKCKFYTLQKNDNGQEPEPCNTCLTETVNLNSRKPVKFEENKKEPKNA